MIEWVRSTATLIGVGFRTSVRGDRSMAIRNPAVVLCTGLVVAVIAVAWQAPTAAAHRQAVQTERELWPAEAFEPPLHPFSADAQVAASSRQSRWGNERVTIVVLTGSGEIDPPPGVVHSPRPGEAVVSPALAEILDSPAGSLLRVRVPGDVIGTIGRAGLVEPDELYAYVGVAEGETIGTYSIAGWGSPVPRDAGLSGGTFLLLVFATAAAVLPLGYLQGAALRVFSTRREERLASLALVGTSPSRLAWVMIGETLPLLGGGLLLGLVSVRPLAAVFTAALPSGYRMYTDLLTPTPGRVAAIAVTLLAVATVTAFRSLQTMRVSPLGTVRKAVAARPAARTIAIPAVGFVGLVVVDRFTVSLARGNVAVTALAFASLALIVLGMPVAVRLVTFAGSRVLARSSERYPAADIAANQLLHSGAGTQRVAGLVALLVFGAAVPQAILPLLAAATGTVTSDGISGVSDAAVLVMVDGRAPDAVMSELTDLGPVATVVRSSAVAQDGSFSGEVWFTGCAELGLVFSEPPVGCGATSAWLANASGPPFGSPASVQLLLGSDQHGGQTITESFTVPSPTPFGGTFPDLLVDTPVLVVPTEALDARFWGTVSDDPFRLRQLVVVTSDVEAVREATWSLPLSFRDRGWVVTADELAFDAGEQLGFLTRLVSWGLGVGFVLAALGVVLTSAAAAAEQRYTYAQTWALGMPRSGAARVQAIRAMVPVAIASVIGGGFGATVGYVYLRFADAAESPLLAGPLLGLNMAGIAAWTLAGLLVGILAAAATLPLTLRTPSVQLLRAE